MQIKMQRERLEFDMGVITNSIGAIKQTGSDILHHPIASIDNSLSNNLSSKQIWSAMGVAFLVGNALTYLRNRNPQNQSQQTIPTLLSAILLKPVADGVIQQVQGLGKRAMDTFLHSPSDQANSTLKH